MLKQQKYLLFLRTDDFNVQSKELRSFDIKGVALATPVPLNVHICNSNVHDALITLRVIN